MTMRDVIIHDGFSLDPYIEFAGGVSSGVVLTCAQRTTTCTVA